MFWKRLAGWILFSSMAGIDTIQFHLSFYYPRTPLPTPPPPKREKNSSLWCRTGTAADETAQRYILYPPPSHPNSHLHKGFACAVDLATGSREMGIKTRRAVIYHPPPTLPSNRPCAAVCIPLSVCCLGVIWLYQSCAGSCKMGSKQIGFELLSPAEIDDDNDDNS